jgi:hypothetical protein
MNFEEAREQAIDSALVDLAGLFVGARNEILETRHLETEHCWMFFRRQSIEVPEERSLSDFAYVFSKHTGEGRCVPNYWGDQVKLQSYLKLISDYFSAGAPPADV